MSDNIFKLPVATQCRREAARMDNQNDDQAWAIFIRAADHIVALEARVKELEADRDSWRRVSERLEREKLKVEAANLGLTKTLVEMEAENANTMREASSLAMSLWKRHYQDASPEFRLCDSVAGIISQIDNMTAGISNDLKQMKAENAELRKAGDALRQELHIFVVAHGHPHSAAPLVAIAEWHNITQQADDEGGGSVIDLKHARLGRLVCWLWFGHVWDKTGSRRMTSRSMNTCEKCGAYEAGPD